jgi:flagellar protein FlaG
MSISVSTAAPLGEPRYPTAAISTANTQQGTVAVPSSAVQAPSVSSGIDNQTDENSLPQTGSEANTSEASGQQLEEAISSIKDFVQSINRDLDFTMDDSTGQVVVKVTDGTSGEVIRQIPSEETLRLAKSLSEVRSLLFEAKA